MWRAVSACRGDGSPCVLGWERGEFYGHEFEAFPLAAPTAFVGFLCGEGAVFYAEDLEEDEAADVAHVPEEFAICCSFADAAAGEEGEWAAVVADAVVVPAGGE